MTTYNTYQEANIANPDANILVNHAGKFRAVKESPTSHFANGWKLCNPADYCMTVEQFLEDGHKFAIGDYALDEFGFVIHLTCSTESWSKKDSVDSYRYVLRAKALEQPKQVEWEVFHSERWIPCIRFGLDIFGHYAYQLSDGEFKGEFDGTPYESSFRKPESPEEKEQRERLDAAYDLYTHVQSVRGQLSCKFDCFSNPEMEEARLRFLAIVDKTNYRKGGE